MFTSFVWDEAKRLKTRTDREIDFVDAARMFDGIVFTRESNRPEFGELRWLALGAIDGRILAVVFTIRPGDVCRIISARPASRLERRLYEAHSEVKDNTRRDIDLTGRATASEGPD